MHMTGLDMGASRFGSIPLTKQQSPLASSIETFHVDDNFRTVPRDPFEKPLNSGGFDPAHATAKDGFTYPNFNL